MSKENLRIMGIATAVALGFVFVVFLVWGIKQVQFTLVLLGIFLIVASPFFSYYASKSGLDMRTKAGKAAYQSRQASNYDHTAPVFFTGVLMLVLAYLAGVFGIRCYYWDTSIDSRDFKTVDFRQDGFNGSFVVEQTEDRVVSLRFDNGFKLTLSDDKWSYVSKNYTPMNNSQAMANPQNVLFGLKSYSYDLISPELFRNDKIKVNSKPTEFKPRNE